MTLNANPDQPPRPLILAFPAEGPHVRLAYRELDLAANGTPEQQHVVGNPNLLTRPWEPATCTQVELRKQLWEWLEAAVIWLNQQQYTWDIGGAMIHLLASPPAPGP